MKKIISIIGARPQFIKHAPIQLALERVAISRTIHTGQHFDENMSDIFFKELKMNPPDYKFKLKGKSHAEQTAEMMVQIEKILLNEQPEAVLVYGDTNSTLAGALAAAKLQIRLIHIEAGLRSFNREMPEEINRVLTDHVSDLLFCPSETAMTNLRVEGVTQNVHLCGDVMKDMIKIAEPFLKNHLPGKPYYFATIHRPYNTDNPTRMKALLEAFQNLKAPVIFPVHPRTTGRITEFNLDINSYPNIVSIPPVGYFDSLSYQRHSNGVITDSGGMQKEAYWLRKKCLTIRKETEWIETLEHGWNHLIYDDLEKIQDSLFMEVPGPNNDMLYGSYTNSNEIVQTIYDFLI
ncbi:UDP-N-acetylglucosamine 2-epimerase (non-hydrolyzing) [Chitinophaga lutea]|uniref:UDP-N-acetylglucosamine 2-epimerase (Non-hydrolyzing) n=1 Tax=Chitinophaga lutea TaxID=2488634 RepID=A0A3N4QB87_9BACT|nr:UDP-N-acetylglucosamine 2-epimerase (non-hydrolyzing) [Chitinophaga lutea]RPE13237.1 UDP-N-acetylglucosamine 2-epimerase (non-hydrolyzing) [Chitinophaga lutea]